jgi:uncharacterized protein (DUF1697 family)
MTRFVALLRGINVGGKNLIRMSDLKACFEASGFRRVRTYIQSGNVLFESAGGARTLAPRIEEMLTSTFDYPASVVLRTRRQMRAIVDHAPRGFGAEPAKYRYDVLFLKELLTAKSALASVPTREGVDRVHAGTGVLYFARLTAKASESRLSRLVSMPIYREMTIRNWNTTTTLLEMLEEGPAD